jgi:hypothetical protein
MMNEQLTPSDLRQMAAMGLAPDDANRQIELFRHPPPFTRLIRACTPGDGILALPQAGQGELLAAFDSAARNGRIGKLVPASGAASRMFKDLLAFHADGAHGADDSDRADPPAAVAAFFANLPRFAFCEDLGDALRAGGAGMDAAVRLPKGLLCFHRYPDGPRTPSEEHLVEAAALCRDAEGLCRVHFTVSPEHLEGFQRLVERVQPKLAERLGCRFAVTFSTQRRATDTLAVDPLDQPFRLADGSLLFRPGGHGALLENLHELGRQGWDVVFLKNIDNVVRDDSKPLVHLWKKLLGGLLVSVQRQAFAALDPRASAGAGRRGIEVCRQLGRELPPGFPAAEPAEKRRLLLAALDRPMRVCGVVRNQGEPGGGPFWAQSSTGGISPQIVEASQVDPQDPRQQAILRSSTHFNPVDIVCGLRDRDGAPYDLDRYVDPATIFISAKTFEGRPLKALERPGLWNGAMAEWNTLFVEVPDATFAPVKTVLDLLRPEHQGLT